MNALEGSFHWSEPSAAICFGCHHSPWQTTNPQLAFLMFIALSPLVSLVAGILILIFPRLLNFIVAIDLIVVGLLGLMHR